MSRRRSTRSAPRRESPRSRSSRRGWGRASSASARCPAREGRPCGGGSGTPSCEPRQRVVRSSRPCEHPYAVARQGELERAADAEPPRSARDDRSRVRRAPVDGLRAASGVCTGVHRGDGLSAARVRLPPRPRRRGRRMRGARVRERRGLRGGDALRLPARWLHDDGGWRYVVLGLVCSAMGGAVRDRGGLRARVQLFGEPQLFRLVRLRSSTEPDPSVRHENDGSLLEVAAAGSSRRAADGAHRQCRWWRRLLSRPVHHLRSGDDSDVRSRFGLPADLDLPVLDMWMGGRYRERGRARIRRRVHQAMRRSECRFSRSRCAVLRCPRPVATQGRRPRPLARREAPTPDWPDRRHRRRARARPEGAEIGGAETTPGWPLGAVGVFAWASRHRARKSRRPTR